MGFAPTAFAFNMHSVNPHKLTGPACLSAPGLGLIFAPAISRRSNPPAAHARPLLIHMTGHATTSALFCRETDTSLGRQRLLRAAQSNHLTKSSRPLQKIRAYRRDPYLSMVFTAPLV